MTLTVDDGDDPEILNDYLVIIIITTNIRVDIFPYASFEFTAECAHIRVINQAVSNYCAHSNQLD